MKYLLILMLVLCTATSYAGGVSLNEAAERVQNSTGGRVVSAQTVRQDGREMHRIKVLTPQGEVRIIYVDAQTGDMR